MIDRVLLDCVITTYSVAGVIVCLYFVWSVLYFIPNSCILKCVCCEEVNVKMIEFPIHSSTPRGEVSGVAYVTYSQFRRCIDLGAPVGRVPAVYC